MQLITPMKKAEGLIWCKTEQSWESSHEEDSCQLSKPYDTLTGNGIIKESTRPNPFRTSNRIDIIKDDIVAGLYLKMVDGIGVYRACSF